MSERCLPADELDAAIGVGEVETGYRDTWRNWLAGDDERRRGVVRRLLKRRRLRVGGMDRALHRIRL